MYSDVAEYINSILYFNFKDVNNRNIHCTSHPGHVMAFIRAQQCYDIISKPPNK